MPKPIRSAVVGTGFIGEVHARAIRAAGGVVACIAASTATSAQRAQHRHLAERAAASAAEAIAAEDVDLVHICTPNAAHSALAQLAIDAGKHVICEKPLAVDIRQTGQLVSAVQGAGLVNAVPFVYRFYPTVREARARCAAGVTGAAQLIHGSYLQDWLADDTDTNWRVDPRLGGRSRVFGDIGVHWCDLAEFVTGHLITRVHARFATVYPQRGPADARMPVATEDCATITFETDRGAVGSVVLSQVSLGRRNRLWLSVDGSMQSLAFDQELPESLWVARRDAVEVVYRGTSTEFGALVDPYNIVPPGHPQGYQDCFTAFIRDVHKAVRGERPDGLPTFADGHRAALLTDAVSRSAASGTPVDVGQEWA